MRRRRVKDEKGQKPEEKNGSNPWVGTACAWEPEHAWGGSTYKGQRLQEPCAVGMPMYKAHRSWRLQNQYTPGIITCAALNWKSR